MFVLYVLFVVLISVNFVVDDVVYVFSFRFGGIGKA